ncbi:MAG: response regulator transcription factor, partial [Bacteroides sp.]|nr:response regulator transcription factor [Bacteroides sp.]
GADDYISKPFSIKEVVARVKAVLRRFVRAENVAEKKEVVSNYGRLEVNTELKEVRIDGSVLELTKKEYEILMLLATNQDKMFSREDIIDKLWKDTPYITERTVDVHITRLRKKMGDCATMIVNRAGYGYRFNQQ